MVFRFKIVAVKEVHNSEHEREAVEQAFAVSLHLNNAHGDARFTLGVILYQLVHVFDSFNIGIPKTKPVGQFLI